MVMVRDRRKFKITKISLYFSLTLITAIFLLPIIMTMLLAFRPTDTNFILPPHLFFKPTLDAARNTILNWGQNGHQILSSLIISTMASFLNLPISFLAAYGLSRYKFKAKNQIMMWYLSLLMAPSVVFVIPYFVLFSKLHIRGSFISLIIVLQTITVPFSIWLMKSFLDEIPVELEEAAKIDGANLFQLIYKITLPLCAPGVIVTSMFSFVFAWNNVTFPLTLSNSGTSTIPIGTLGYFTTSGANWNNIGMTAASAIIPPMFIFLILDRFVVRGLTFGAIKG